MTRNSGLYARSFSDVYDAWYGELDNPAHLVRSVTQRCTPGAIVIEMGSGTGRLATPLYRAGFEVLALDISLPMLAATPPGPHALRADMTCLPLRADSLDMAVIAYNTLFNVVSRAEQERCLVEVARTLRPNGFLGVETFVAPANSTSGFGISTRPHPTEPGAQLAILTGPHATEPEVIVGSHIERGAARVCRPWHLTYQSPAQLDDSAGRAGLRLESRFSDWSGSPFGSDEPRQVSWYKPI